MLFGLARRYKRARSRVDLRPGMDRPPPSRPVRRARSSRPGKGNFGILLGGYFESLLQRERVNLGLRPKRREKQERDGELRREHTPMLADLRQKPCGVGRQNQCHLGFCKRNK